MILNKGQQFIVDSSVPFYKNSYEQVMQIDGPAGTGKSVVLNAIAERLNIPKHRIAAMAYIGQAAIIMKLNGFRNAKTIHSWLLNPIQVIKRDILGNPMYDQYYNTPIYENSFEPKILDGIDLIFIDEAGTVPYHLKHEIERRGIKIIAAGDLAQLPPVADKPAYLYSGKVYHLTEPMRQGRYSNILALADLVRHGYEVPYGFFGDCLVIDQDEITDQMLLNSNIVICGKNKTRDMYNRKIRRLLGFNTDIPCCGEKLICKKNNWFIDNDGINLANGMLGTVVNNPGMTNFDGKTFGIDFKPLLFNGVFSGLRLDYEYFTAPVEDRQKIKMSKYSQGEKFEYGYAITTHSSQGSAFNSVLYVSEFLNKDIQKNLDYTGITRARQLLIYAKQKRKFYSFSNSKIDW